MTQVFNVSTKKQKSKLFNMPEKIVKAIEVLNLTSKPKNNKIFIRAVFILKNEKTLKLSLKSGHL